MQRWVVQRLRCLFGRPGLGRRDVAKDQLCQLVGLAVPPDLHDIVHTLVDFGARLIRQQLVDDPLVQTQLAPVAGDLEHIVLGRVHRTAVYLGRPLGERLYHLFLDFGGLGHDVVVLHLRRGQMQLVGGLNIRHLFEQVHQLRQVEKLAESCSCPVAGSFRGKLQRGAGLPEAAGPAVKVGHAQLLQAVILEIPLHGIKFGGHIGDTAAWYKVHKVGNATPYFLSSVVLA